MRIKKRFLFWYFFYAKCIRTEVPKIWVWCKNDDDDKDDDNDCDEDEDDNYADDEDD